MERISNKSRDALYNAVSEEVMQARLKIEKLKIEDEFIKDQIDSIMFTLYSSAPQKALDCFPYNKER